MYPAFGNNELRLSWLDKLEQAHIPVMTLVHPTAYVSPTAKVEPGNNYPPPCGGQYRLHGEPGLYRQLRRHCGPRLLAGRGRSRMSGRYRQGRKPHSKGYEN